MFAVCAAICRCVPRHKFVTSKRMRPRPAQPAERPRLTATSLWLACVPHLLALPHGTSLRPVCVSSLLALAAGVPCAPGRGPRAPQGRHQGRQRVLLVRQGHRGRAQVRESAPRALQAATSVRVCALKALQAAAGVRAVAAVVPGPLLACTRCYDMALPLPHAKRCPCCVTHCVGHAVCAGGSA